MKSKTDIELSLTEPITTVQFSDILYGRSIDDQNRSHFDWIAEDAIERLAAIGIEIPVGKMIMLQARCEIIANDERALWDVNVQSREHEIVKLIDNLQALLKEREDQDFWYETILNEERGKIEIDETVEVQSFMSDLSVVRANALSRVQFHESGLDGRKMFGNRALLDRQLYWDELLDFWVNGLGREIAASKPNEGDGKPVGPLVKFYMIMCERGLSCREMTPIQIYNWIKLRKKRGIPSGSFWVFDPDN
jgi:hypothetical protein